MQKTFSRRLWELDWSRHLPWVLDEGVRVEEGSVDEILTFMRCHYGSIFAVDPEDQRFLPDAFTEAKRRFLSASDRLAFRDGDQIVGVLVGNPIDWSTYYWRTVAFLPEHQGRGLLAAALERTDRVLRSVGVERIEGDAAPTNYRQIRLLLRLGYCVTGSSNSERWGAMLRLTRFLNEEGERVFTTRYCRTPLLPGATARDAGTKGGRDEEVRYAHRVSRRSASADLGAVHLEGGGA